MRYSFLVCIKCDDRYIKLSIRRDRFIVILHIEFNFTYNVHYVHTIHSLAMTSLLHWGSLSHTHSPKPTNLTEVIDDKSILSSSNDMKISLPTKPTWNPALSTIKYNSLNSMEERAPKFNDVVCLMATPSASCKYSWACDPGAVLEYKNNKYANY